MYIIFNCYIIFAVIKKDFAQAKHPDGTTKPRPETSATILFLSCWTSSYSNICLKKKYFHQLTWAVQRDMFCLFYFKFILMVYVHAIQAMHYVILWSR